MVFKLSYGPLSRFKGETFCRCFVAALEYVDDSRPESDDK